MTMKIGAESVSILAPNAAILAETEAIAIGVLAAIERLRSDRIGGVGTSHLARVRVSTRDDKTTEYRSRDRMSLPRTAEPLTLPAVAKALVERSACCRAAPAVFGGLGVHRTHRRRRQGNERARERKSHRASLRALFPHHFTLSMPVASIFSSSTNEEISAV